MHSALAFIAVLLHVTLANPGARLGTQGLRNIGRNLNGNIGRSIGHLAEHSVLPSRAGQRGFQFGTHTTWNSGASKIPSYVWRSPVRPGGFNSGGLMGGMRSGTSGGLRSGANVFYHQVRYESVDAVIADARKALEEAQKLIKHVKKPSNPVKPSAPKAPSPPKRFKVPTERPMTAEEQLEFVRDAMKNGEGISVEMQQTMETHAFTRAYLEALVEEFAYQHPKEFEAWLIRRDPLKAVSPLGARTGLRGALRTGVIPKEYQFQIRPPRTQQQVAETVAEQLYQDPSNAFFQFMGPEVLEGRKKLIEKAITWGNELFPKMYGDLVV